MTKLLAILLLSNNLMCLKAMQELDQNDTRSNKSFVSQTSTKTTQSLLDAMEKFGNHFKPTYANFSWFQELATFTGGAIKALEKQDYGDFKVFARYLYKHTCAHNDKITEKKEISDKVILNNFANPAVLQFLRQFHEDASLDQEYLEYLKDKNSPSKTVFSNLAANLKTLTQTLGTYRQLPSGESLKPILEKLLKNSQTARIRLKDLQQKKDEASFIEKEGNISMISGTSRSYLTNNQANISVRSGLNYSNDNDSQNLSGLNLSVHTISAYHSKIERKNSSPAKLLGAIIEEDSAKKVASQKNSPEKSAGLETPQFLPLPFLVLHPAPELVVDRGEGEDINLDSKQYFLLEGERKVCLDDKTELQTEIKLKPVIQQQEKEIIATEPQKTDSALVGQGYRNSLLTQTRKEVPISNKSPVRKTESCIPCSIF